MANLDDNELIAHVSQGDQQAFLALYDRYISRVHGLTLQILTTQCWPKRPHKTRFSNYGAVPVCISPNAAPCSLWLLTIARHTALDRLRLESRRPVENEADDPEDTFQSIPDLDTLPESLAGGVYILQFSRFILISAK